MKAPRTMRVLAIAAALGMGLAGGAVADEKATEGKPDAPAVKAAPPAKPAAETASKPQPPSARETSEKQQAKKQDD